MVVAGRPGRQLNGEIRQILRVLLILPWSIPQPIKETTAVQVERPEKLIDPVCGMTVDVAMAEAGGRLLEHEGRTWAFCREGCRRAFAESPAEYIAQAEVATSRAPDPKALPMIDEGMRRWYESCSCCLSETYPEIKAQLDAERAEATQPTAELGICEEAEAVRAN
jgi:YHS domain-containing protein